MDVKHVFNLYYFIEINFRNILGADIFLNEIVT